MKLKEIVNTYKLLGEAKVMNLTEEEVLLIVIARKKMRKLVMEYEEYLKDIQDKLKPDDFDEMVTKAQNWDNLSKKEQTQLGIKLKEYEAKVNNMVKDELEKEIELQLEPLPEECLAKLIKMNGWAMNKVDELSAIL